MNQGVDPMPLFPVDGIQIRVVCASLEAAKGSSRCVNVAMLPTRRNCEILFSFKIDESFLKGQRANNM